MNEPTSLDKDGLDLVERVVAALYDRLVQTVIAELKALPESCRQSGDDSMLKDVWEEFKYQIQGDHSIMFEFYEQTIEEMCSRAVITQDRELRQLLWLWTEGFGNCWVDKDTVSIDDFVAEDINRELYNRVCDVAGNEELAVNPDEDRDRARYEEDMEGNRPESG